MTSSATVRVIIIAALTLAALLIYNFLLTAKRADVIIAPSQLPPDGHSQASVRVVLLNRAGFTIPFRHPRLRIEITQGRELARLHYTEDSTEAVFRAGYQSGRIEMQITTPAYSFPMFAVLDIVPQLAAAKVGREGTGLSTFYTCSVKNENSTGRREQEFCNSLQFRSIAFKL
jgi:hypothetical protein